MGAHCTLNPQSPSPAVVPPFNTLKGHCHPGVLLPGSLPTEPLNWLLQPSTPTKSPTFPHVCSKLQLPTWHLHVGSTDTPKLAPKK